MALTFVCEAHPFIILDAVIEEDHICIEVCRICAEENKDVGRETAPSEYDDGFDAGYDVGYQDGKDASLNEE